MKPISGFVITLSHIYSNFQQDVDCLLKLEATPLETILLFFNCRCNVQHCAVSHPAGRQTLAGRDQ